MNEHMGLVGRKLGMTQFFQEDGEVVGVTVIEVGPNTITALRKDDGKDGYNALQLAFGERKASRATKSEKGHVKAAGLDEAPPEVIREVRVARDVVEQHEVGKKLGAADVFQVGQVVDVIGTSKGRGFAGVMKRHNFRGFIRSHGVHEYFRHGGSIGTRLTPGHVMKGKRMPGHMGNAQVTAQNLTIARVDADRNLIMVRGGVPGPKGAIVIVRAAAKS